MNDDERFIDAGTVARRLGVSDQTIRNWILSARIAGVRTLTGRYQVPVDELKRLLKLKKSQTATP